MSKVGVKNPLFLLDEIDKMASDMRGDPASALLEVLDPEQNNSFNDHYLEVDYDLSDVMFVATSNSMNIPGPLLDEREISKICRKAVKNILLNKDVKHVTVNQDNLKEYLGVQRFDFGKADEHNRIGQVTGLAWTEVGGDLLTIEAQSMPGKGKLTQTGSLGEVMQESIQAAMTVVRSRAEKLGINPDFYEKRDIHVHVPEGATPKDGPSAGTAMCTALLTT